MFSTTIMLTKEETVLLLDSLELHQRAIDAQDPKSLDSVLRERKIKCDDLSKRLNPWRM